MDLLYVFIQRILGALLGLLLFYSALKLIKVLRNKEIAVSMVFLQKNKIINLFGLLVVSGFLIFITGLYFTLIGNSIVVEILLDLTALILLIFTLYLQKIMGGEDKWI
jgi:hypothetical protein